MAPYRTCIECGRVYDTPQDLVDAFNALDAHTIAMWPDLKLTIPAPEPENLNVEDVDAIWSCPVCLHDW